MEKDNLIFRCMTCYGTAVYTEDRESPICCGRPMAVEPLESCTSAPHPEMARNSNTDEPCDDGRGNKV